jgi:mitogen-activated protein kinase organizer 1
MMSPASNSAFPSTPLTQLVGSNGPIHALTYSSSPGTYILTGSADRNIRLYNPFPAQASGVGVVGPSKLIQTYAAHGYEVLDIAVSRCVSASSVLPTECLYKGKIILY